MAAESAPLAGVPAFYAAAPAARPVDYRQLMAAGSYQQALALINQSPPAAAPWTRLDRDLLGLLNHAPQPLQCVQDTQADALARDACQLLQDRGQPPSPASQAALARLTAGIATRPQLGYWLRAYQALP